MQFCAMWVLHAVHVSHVHVPYKSMTVNKTFWRVPCSSSFLAHRQTLHTLSQPKQDRDSKICIHIQFHSDNTCTQWTTSPYKLHRPRCYTKKVTHYTQHASANTNIRTGLISCAGVTRRGRLLSQPIIFILATPMNTTNMITNCCSCIQAWTISEPHLPENGLA